MSVVVEMHIGLTGVGPINTLTSDYSVIVSDLFYLLIKTTL